MKLCSQAHTRRSTRSHRSPHFEIGRV
uniref:Uncharacterized protein n=1 Tax=Arundo donax TaxID=35708 RepID=A0A0A9FC80_ARUDO